MKKIFLLLLIFFCLPKFVLAQTDFYSTPQTYRAQVLEIIHENSEIRENNTTSYQQILKLKITEGDLKNRIVEYDGTKYDVLNSARYQMGDKVIINRSVDVDGQEMFYVTDYNRAGALFWLTGLFALLVIIIGRLKGLRALIVLILTFVVVLKFIIPKILIGANPLLISIIGALVILISAIYLTEGFRRRSHLAISAIFISLIITGVLSVIFISFTKLTGFISEDIAFLTVSSVGGLINIKGLLLAGIIIGALGVLDDVVISQVVLIEELVKANSKLSRLELYRRGMSVGVSHLASMSNTLFLAYAGASLPLLILFFGAGSSVSFMHALSNEVIATEIVRTLTGSIGLVLAVPIATGLAAWFSKNNKIK